MTRPIGDRWADDEELFVANPRRVEVMPQWRTDQQQSNDDSASATSDPTEDEQKVDAGAGARRHQHLRMLGVIRAAGADVTPGEDKLHRWWTAGPGLARWKDWTDLETQLVAAGVEAEKAKRFAAAWFHERYGFWPGDDKNRIMHGNPPRGHVVGPG